MNSTMKNIYIPVKQNEKINNIQVYIRYYLGSDYCRYYLGSDYCNSRPRGYYAYIIPVKLTNKGSYSTAMCSPSDGIFALLKVVKRKSMKSEIEARVALKANLQDILKQVLSKNNLQLEDFNLSDIIDDIDELEIQ